MSEPEQPTGTHSSTEGHEEQWANRELQQKRWGREECRRCGGTGFVIEGTSATRDISSALVWLAMAASFLILGIGIGRWVTF